MRFGSSHFFWCLFALPLLVGFFIWVYQRKQNALRRFASLELLQRLAPTAALSRQIVKWTLLLLLFFFLIMALVRPRFGVRMEMIERKGVDVMIALDISQSMLAEDIAPNRLDRAKHEIAKFIDLLKGDRIGINVFAGESYVQCPLTLDYGAAKMFLDAVTTDWVNIQGTNLSDAIGKAMSSFRSQAKKSKVLLLLSDGEDHEGSVLEVAKKAAQDGAKIYAVGIGSESGVPIPLRKSGGNVVYKKDNAGNLVLTKLDQTILEKVALEGSGRYFHAGTNLDLAAIYEEIMKMEKVDLGINRVSVYEEQYQIFLLIALALLIAEFLVPERARVRTTRTGRVGSGGDR